MPQSNRDRRSGGLCLGLVVGACFGGEFVQGLPCGVDKDCGPQLRCMKRDGEAEGLCGGPGHASLCGNGLQDEGEECDDGNMFAGDACTPECKVPRCGDGFVAMDEACDDMIPCDGDEECRAELGPGWVCGAEVLCTPVTPHPRCTDTYPHDLLTTPDKYRDAIVFGSLLDHNPYNGDLVMVAAANLAVRQANQSGLEGRLFGLVHCDYSEDAMIDDMTSDEAADETARYLVDTFGTPVILGPGTSSLAESVFTTLHGPAYADSPALLISSSASSDSLTSIDVDLPGLFWRTTPSDATLGDAMAVRMGEEEVTEAHVLYVEDSYGRGIVNSLGSFDGSLNLYGFNTPAEISEIVQNIDMEHDPAPGLAVVFIGSTVDDVVDFLAAASGLDLYNDDRTLLFFADAGYNEAVITSTDSFAAPLYDQVRVAFRYDDTRGPAYSGFEAALLAEFSAVAEASSYSASTYDAAWLAVYGAAWAHYQRGDAPGGIDLAYGLQQISDERASETGCAFPVTAITWPIVQTCFKEGIAIDARGASGNLDYDPKTEELKNGAAHFYNIDPSSQEFVCLDCEG